MKKALIIHGCCDEEEYISDKYPSSSNSHWIPWLQKQLLIKNILTQSPEFPKPFNPDFEKWREVLMRFAIDGDIFTKWSCGDHNRFGAK